MIINELEDLLGVTRETLRYYVDQGLVPPPREENGYRDYSDEEVRLFQKIIVLRKLGVSVKEIKDLIEGKTDLHDVLERNVDRLRTQKSDSDSAIDLCRQLGSEAADFDSIDPVNYLKSIYEAEQNGEYFAPTSEISFRQLNFAITMLGMMAGAALPQNKLYSEHSNDPIPDDIRGNKKAGDEYDTVGDVLRKGGKRKTIVIVVALVLAVLAIVNGLFIMGFLGGAGNLIHDYNKSGITIAVPDDEEMARIAEIEPDAVRACSDMELLKFHTQGGLLLKFKVSEDRAWTEFDKIEIDAEEGYLFITGLPASKVEVHVIADGKRTKHIIEVNDSKYDEDEFAMIEADQLPLNEEQMIALFCRDSDARSEAEEIMNSYLNYDIQKNVPSDGCYIITAQSAEH